MINYLKQFANFANKIAQFKSLLLAGKEVLKEPEEVKIATPIPETLKVQKVMHERNKHGVFCNKIFYLSADDSPFYRQ